jgi:hypothetical protein
MTQREEDRAQKVEPIMQAKPVEESKEKNIGKNEIG